MKSAIDIVGLKLSAWIESTIKDSVHWILFRHVLSRGRFSYRSDVYHSDIIGLGRNTETTPRRNSIITTAFDLSNSVGSSSSSVLL